MKYNKLIRDKIPEIMEKKWVNFTSHIADNTEYWFKLKEKLQEEVSEVLEDDCILIEELADTLEVIYAICDFKGISREELEEIRKQKQEKRWGFKDRIILDETSL